MIQIVSVAFIKYLIMNGMRLERLLTLCVYTQSLADMQ